MFNQAFVNIKSFHCKALKEEIHSHLQNMTFINKLQFPLISRSSVFKVSKN